VLLPTMASVGVQRELPTAVWRENPLGLCGRRDQHALKGTVQPWFTKTDEEPASFPLVWSEADLTRGISARPASMAAQHLVKGPQCARANVCKFHRLRWFNTVGFIPHGGKQCWVIVTFGDAFYSHPLI
jgi:hypothetical protein